MTQAENLSGLIERVTFFNEANGFAVLKVQVKGHRELLTVVGSLPSVSAGEWVTAEGQWVHDREFGQQFKADATGWKLLSGDWDQVYDVVTGLKVATRSPRPAFDAPAPGGTELTHSTRIVLIDAQQQVRAYLEGQDASADDLVKAVKRVLK